MVRKNKGRESAGKDERLWVVPWFSKEEWIEVYKATFSDDVKKWKHAFGTMTVWQSRLYRTHIGIAVTRHLLQAKILDSDPAASQELKSGANAIAITKFVSTIIKIPAERYPPNESQSQVPYRAREDWISLPSMYPCWNTAGT
nr:ribosomal biogenesis protein LAS1L-like [Penaeus vannamei]